MPTLKKRKDLFILFRAITHLGHSNINARFAPKKSFAYKPDHIKYKLIWLNLMYRETSLIQRTRSV